MPRSWAVSFGEKERVELERIILDEDAKSALGFLTEIVYAKVKESEKPGSCYHDVNKPVDELPRSVKKQKELGSFD